MRRKTKKKTAKKPADGCHRTVPVHSIEFSDKAIWVHAAGGTVMRIQPDGHVLGYRTLNPGALVPFCDIRVKGDISVHFPSKREG